MSPLIAEDTTVFPPKADKVLITPIKKTKTVTNSLYNLIRFSAPLHVPSPFPIFNLLYCDDVCTWLISASLLVSCLTPTRTNPEHVAAARLVLHALVPGFHHPPLPPHRGRDWSELRSGPKMAAPQRTMDAVPAGHGGERTGRLPRRTVSLWTWGEGRLRRPGGRLELLSLKRRKKRKSRRRKAMRTLPSNPSSCQVSTWWLCWLQYLVCHVNDWIYHHASACVCVWLHCQMVGVCAWSGCSPGRWVSCFTARCPTATFHSGNAGTCSPSWPPHSGSPSSPTSWCGWYETRTYALRHTCK